MGEREEGGREMGRRRRREGGREREWYGKLDIQTCNFRFIQKQGLDRTFIECDNHMWRVDRRTLPNDINVDGGSDWIAIHRNYSHYLITSKEPFLTDIKRYYEFSLLPAEVCVVVVCVCGKRGHS